MIPLERKKPRGNNHEKILAFFLAFSFYLRQYLQPDNMFTPSAIRHIITIAFIFALVSCLPTANTQNIAPVVTQHDSEDQTPVVSNKRIVCQTNGRLYPCITTSVKTPISSSPEFRVSPGPDSIASGTTPGMTNAAQPELVTTAPHGHSVSDTHHEAIAFELRELVATLGALIAGPTDSRPEPQTAAGPEREPVPASPPGPDDAAVRDRAPGPDPHPVISDHRQRASVPSSAAASRIDPEPAAGSHVEPPIRNADDAAPARALLASVYFPFNSVSLLPSEKIVLIDLLAQIRGKRLLVVGFTDRLGDKDTNVQLAYRRARAVKTFFRNTGLDPANLFAAAKGQCCYKNDGTTPMGRQQNRRVEIYETTENFQPRPLTSE